MQRFILKRKNLISLVSFILIATALVMHYGFNLSLEPKILLIIASVIGVIPIAIQAFQALRVKVVSIDLLVTIAVIGAFIINNYEESAIVTFLFLFGAFLEQKTLNKTRKAIKELTEMAPLTANKLQDDGEFIEVDIDEVEVDDILIVKTGAKVPVDGVIIFGEGHVDEATITGESVPINKTVGNKVFAGTILTNGTIQIKAEKVGEDTTFGKIIELVEEAQDSKSAAEKFIDKFAKYYTPIVLLLAIIVGIILKDIAIAVTVLVLGCPGALVIGVPVSNVSGIGNGARHGILLKGSEVINDFSKIDVMVFDKTGTLTSGKPEVSDVVFYDENHRLWLSLLLAVEKESLHPLAVAITQYIAEFDNYIVNETEVQKGSGIIANVSGYNLKVGNEKLLRDHNILVNEKITNDIKSLELQGNSVVITVVNDEVKLIMGIKDTIRPNAKMYLDSIRYLGVKQLILLSGDNQGTVEIVAKELELDIAIGHMLPQDKQQYIIELQKQGRIVAFVGDGVNDAPSLASANIGIAMGGGTDVAIETSDVVLMNSDLNKLPHALGLAKKISRNMKQNIIIAIAVVLVLLTSLIFSDWMNMSIGMLVHEGSILVVILNGMRLLRYKYKQRR